MVLCVNIGDDAETIEGYWKKEGFTLRAVRQEEDAVSRAFGVSVYPTNYVVGPDGKVRWRGVGWNEEAVRKHLLGTGAGS